MSAGSAETGTDAAEIFKKIKKDTERERMFSTFLIKYGEIGIKGKNRHLFEQALVKRIRQALHGTEGDFDVTWEQGHLCTAFRQF